MALLHRTIEYLTEYADGAAECWLGYARPPPEREMSRLGWSPDARSAYCARCGETVGDGEVADARCATCRGAPALGDGVVRLGTYAGPLRDWILSVKYQRWSDMGIRLGRLLGRSLREADGDCARHAVVVPMPMPPLRRWHRGIDHAAVLARGLADELRLPLRRVLCCWAGRPQITRIAHERRRLGGRGLTLSAGGRLWPPRCRRIVLVDDVRTTGSSLRGAISRLRPLGPAGIVVAVTAVADRPGRSGAAADGSPAPVSKKDPD